MGGEEEVEMDMCLLCAEDQALFAVYGCGHNSVCYKCALRMRFMTRYKKKDEHKRLLCPECQTSSDTLHIVRCEDRDSELGKGLEDPKWKGVFGADKDILQDINFLRGLYCPLWEECGVEEEFKNLDALRAHMNKKHGATLCGVCFEMRPLFLSEHMLYTPKQMRQHESMTERCELDDSNFYGHPKCYFCNQLFYDPEHLLEHMYHKHLTCDLCKGRPTTFHKNMSELVQHWRDEHYYCDKCHSQHGGLHSKQHHPSEWAFATEIDFQAHNNKWHEVGKKAIQIQMGSQSYMDQQRNHRSGGYNSQSSSGAPEPLSDDKIWFCMGRQLQTVSLGLPQRDTSPQRERDGARGRGRGRGVAVEEKAEPPPGRGRGRGMAAGDVEAPQGESYKERNIRMMSKMKMLFDNNLKKFNQFRLLSSDFLKGEMMAADFYDQMLVYFGSDLDQIFGELVELLPDEKKQTGLRLVHNTVTSKERGVPDPPPPPKSQGIGKKKQPPGPQPTASSSSAAYSGGSYSTRLRTGATASPSHSPPPVGARNTVTADASQFPTLGGDAAPKKKPGAKVGGVWGKKPMARR